MSEPAAPPLDTRPHLLLDVDTVDVADNQLWTRQPDPEHGLSAGDVAQFLAWLDR